MPPENQLLVGLVDFHADVWCADYFPEECPPDWRFSYYSNDFRGVCLSADFWTQGDTEIAQWVARFTEDDDPGFYFVLSFSGQGSAQIDENLARVAAIAPQIACLVLETPGDAGEFNAWHSEISALEMTHPVALQLSADFAQHPANADTMTAAMDLAKAKNWSLVWAPEAPSDMAPIDCGEFLLVFGQQSDLRGLRTQIEKIDAWMGKNRSAGLFFPPGAARADTVLNARELAEIMGV